MNETKSYRFLTIPNFISLFRILLIIPISYYIWHDNLIPVFILVIIAVISDFLDGIIARRFDQISEWGKILDPLADKLATATLLTVLYLKHRVPLWLVIIIVSRDLVIIFAGIFLAQKQKMVTPSNFIGKVTVNVIAILIIAFIFDVKIVQTIFMPLTILFVVLSSYSYIANFIKIHKSKKLT